MIILLNRFAKKASYTVGKIFVNNIYFCDSLELPVKGGGTEKMTAVAPGVYECGIIYSPKFKRNLIEIKNVPARTDIRIHAGNTAKDTDGCILTGKNTVIGTLVQSREYEEKLTQFAENAIKNSDKILMQIV